MFNPSIKIRPYAPNLSLLPEGEDKRAQDAINEAKLALERGEASAAVHDLQAKFGDNKDSFQEVILNFLNSAPASIRQEFIDQARSQPPGFDLNTSGKEGKTALDLAVQLQDRDLARYLLRKGASATSAESQRQLAMWQRQDLFYAHFNENKQDWTALDHALHDCRYDEARDLLRSKIKGKRLRQAWEDAIDNDQKDVLRAILILSTPTHLRALTRQKIETGKWKKAFGKKDPGLSAVLAEFPYQSVKWGKPENFNGKAKFDGVDTDTDTDIDDEDDDDETKIFCRHLVAYQQDEQIRDPLGKIKFDYSKFKSRKEIANNVTRETEERYLALKAQAAETHLIDNAKFGSFLAMQFATMEEKKESTKLMLFESLDHAMNLGLMIKEEDGKKSYVVKFFDPNTTTHHTRSKTNSLASLETQAIEDYLSKEVVNQYYPQDAGFSIIYVRSKEQSQVDETSSSSSSTTGRTLTTCAENINAAVVMYLMNEGFSGSLRQLCDHFKTLPTDQCIELLAAKDVTTGTPALYTSMKNGEADVIRAYAEVLIELASIPDQERTNLIAAKNTDEDETPALFICMQKGHAKAVKAYAKLLALIPEKERIALIAGKRSDHTPALFISMDIGHAEAVKAYGELLKQLPTLIAEQELIELVAAKDTNDTPALHASMANGHADVVQAYGELLKQLTSISEQELIELIAAKNAYDAPALHESMANGYAEAIKAYGELLKQFSTSIPEQELVELIAARDTNDAPALHMSMRKGDVDTVKAYGQLLELLPPDQQIELLLAKDSEEESGLHIALERGKYRVVKEHFEMLEKLVPKLSAEKRAWLKIELAEYEGLVLSPPDTHHCRSSLYEYSDAKKAFSKLQKTLGS